MSKGNDDARRATAPDEALVVANALRRSVTRMARRLRSLRKDHGVSGAKLSLLGRLHRAGRPMTAVELARLEHLQPQSLTRIIADLDQLGLIQRRPDMQDRRQLLIETTAKGEALLAMDALQQNAWLAMAMSAGLSAAERDLLRIAAELMDRLSDEKRDILEESAARRARGETS
ncbi:MAG TPA: MarR family transcriptional regulator [Rhizomicrobium sp.]|jgi:DNA-binding MarR family transcriptional regulator